MILTPCPECGAPRGRRRPCRACSWQPAGDVTRPDLRTSASKRRNAAAVAAHVAAHGYRCPGWRRAEHDATDLTADHPVAVANGGDPDQPLAVLCRSCNGRKANAR
jgi:hypothetical protein